MQGYVYIYGNKDIMREFNFFFLMHKHTTGLILYCVLTKTENVKFPVILRVYIGVNTYHLLVFGIQQLRLFSFHDTIATMQKIKLK